MIIVVAGGGKVGYYLANALKGQNRVSLIERDAARAAYIAETLRGVLVVRGDASNLAILSDAGARDADVIAAVTGKDEDNLVICQLAKWHFNVPRTVARVSNPKNAEIFPRLGIDTTVSGTSLVTHFVEQELTSRDLHLLLQFRKGDMELVEVRLNGTSPAIGKTVAELSLPKDVVLVSVLRDDGAIVPRGSTRLVGGDSVIALTRTGKVAELEDVLAGRPKS